MFCILGSAFCKIPLSLLDGGIQTSCIDLRTAVMSISILNIPTGYQKQTMIYRFFTRALQNTLERLKNCRLAKRVGSATEIIMVQKLFVIIKMRGRLSRKKLYSSVQALFMGVFPLHKLRLQATVVPDHQRRICSWLQSLKQ